MATETQFKDNLIADDNREIQIPSTTLSTKNLFTHYFLIHDFLFRMVKSPSKSGRFFDLQIEVNDAMRKATKMGGNFGQVTAFTGLALYCLKGNSLKLRFLYGFLFIYWIDHFYTLGSYLGVLLRMPSLYKKTGQYYLHHEALDKKNQFLNLNNYMKQNDEYQDTQKILNEVFGEKILDQKHYVTNQYFAKNKDKYFTDEQATKMQKPSTKLKYFDSFLTRYVYYSFERWYRRNMIKHGLLKENI